MTALTGLSLGAGLSLVAPAESGHIPAWLVAPFGLLLASIALMPFINNRFWHDHFPDFSFLLGGIVVSYGLIALDAREEGHTLTYGQEHLLHTALEYYSFIALVGGLFIAAGGILVRIEGRATTTANVAILALGAVIANLIGTTGASMVLIRPFMALNKGRLRPLHIVYFILIVSNCGGCLTPIGDPPLYLGYLKGVPFFWTLSALWLDWILVIALLLAAFAWFDSRAPRPDPDDAAPTTGPRRVVVQGWPSIAILIAIVLCAFVDPLVEAIFHIHGVPIGPTIQIALAILAYRIAPERIHEANGFSFFPVKEVGLLFIGIFATMFPALGFLSQHGEALGLDSPTGFFWACGSLSGVLDNAPTYVCFLQLALQPAEISPATIAGLIASDEGRRILHAISTGAVFFGALTYIGNGPNFMVRAIAETSGVRTHSFFGYFVRAALILGPILVIHWLLLVR